MKEVTIRAEDKDGQLLGTRTVDMPENMEDLHASFEDKDIVELALRSFVIDVQRELRTAARGGKVESDTVKAFKKLTPEQMAKALAAVASA